ncbi:hypothetical protein LXJ15735_28720 [Lacrimispora xylanolytica]
MLVKCPECGKENVSDSANACPDCGYGIRTHFDKIHQDEVRKEQTQKAKIDDQQRVLERIKSVPKPTKPTFSKGLIAYSIMTTLLLSWLFLSDGQIGMWFWEVMLFVIAPFFIYKHKYDKKLGDYNLAKTNFEAYQRQVIQEQDKEIASVRASAEAWSREEAKKPKCPYCNSTDLNKISGLSKAGSVALWGIFAVGKVSKQWHCNGCKSDF